jgi:hypothetical protein
VAVLSALAVMTAGPAMAVVIDGYFVDDNTSQFEDDIDAIAEADITRGCDASGTRYCPSQTVTRGQMAAFLNRALGLPAPEADHFTDDSGSPFEMDINALAEAGITTGCDPEQTRFCPDSLVTRAEMATFLSRAQELPAPGRDYFADDNGSIHEGDINSIAGAGITRGCDATGTRYCPSGAVTRGAMAAFLRRSLGLPSPLLRIPMSDHPSLTCSPTPGVCSLTVDVEAGRGYKTEEGVFQVLPASEQELSEFYSPATGFSLTVDGAEVSLLEKQPSEEAGLIFRLWEYPVAFAPGNHTLVGRWVWNGTQIRLTTVIVRAT